MRHSILYQQGRVCTSYTAPYIAILFVVSGNTNIGNNVEISIKRPFPKGNNAD